jgi:hypothetical protein
VYAWLEIADSGLRLDCHIPEHDASRFFIVNSTALHLEEPEPEIVLNFPPNRSTVGACDLNVAASINIPFAARRGAYHWFLTAELRLLRGSVIQDVRVMLPFIGDNLNAINHTFKFAGSLPFGSMVQVRVRLQRAQSLNVSSYEVVAAAPLLDLFLKRPLRNGTCAYSESHNLDVYHSLEVFEGQECSTDMVIVTAADEPYADRLSNLIGSIQFWEGETSWTVRHGELRPKRPTQIFVYDLGLAPPSVLRVKSWDHVQVLPLPTTSADLNRTPVPSFVRDPAMAWLVSWKPLVVLEALSRHAHVLWVDANAEIRFPLDIPREAIETDGHFFTAAGHLFPTPKTVRQSTLRYFNLYTIGNAMSGTWIKDLHATNSTSVSVTFASRVEYTSAFMGFKRGSKAHTEVLMPMHDCCITMHCIWPNDAAGNTNQRRDQSALNAALARAEIVDGFKPQCMRDKRWWAWTGQDTVQVPFQPGDFDEASVHVFSRRAGQPKPYAPRVKLKA